MFHRLLYFCSRDSQSRLSVVHNIRRKIVKWNTFNSWFYPSSYIHKHSDSLLFALSEKASSINLQSYVETSCTASTRCSSSSANILLFPVWMIYGNTIAWKSHVSFCSLFLLLFLVVVSRHLQSILRKKFHPWAALFHLSSSHSLALFLIQSRFFIHD